jgi:hypothetical protein
MPDNFKNSKFNRGRGYTGPSQEENFENNNEIDDNDNNKLNINDNNNIKSLWGEFQNNYEQGKAENDENENELEDFHDNEEDDDEIKMNTNIQNNILFDKKYNNINDNLVNNNNFSANNNFNNDVDKEETPTKQEEPIKEDLEKNYKEKEDFGIINEDYIKNLMNYDVHDVEDILNLNNKIHSVNDE